MLQTAQVKSCYVGFCEVFILQTLYCCTWDFDMLWVLETADHSVMLMYIHWLLWWLWDGDIEISFICSSVCLLLFWLFFDCPVPLGRGTNDMLTCPSSLLHTMISACSVFLMHWCNNSSRRCYVVAWTLDLLYSIDTCTLQHLMKTSVFPIDTCTLQHLMKTSVFPIDTCTLQHLMKPSVFPSFIGWDYSLILYHTPSHFGGYILINRETPFRSLYVLRPEPLPCFCPNIELMEYNVLDSHVFVPPPSLPLLPPPSPPPLSPPPPHPSSLPPPPPHPLPSCLPVPWWCAACAE